MKVEDIKRQSVPILSINSLMAKPNKKLTKSPSKKSENPKDFNKIKEKRASKFINIQNNGKKERSSYTGKKLINHSKIMQNFNNKNKNLINSGLSPQKGKKYKKLSYYSGYKKIMKKFNFQEKYLATSEKSQKHRKRASIENFTNPKIEENFRKEHEIDPQNDFATNNSDQGHEKEENKKIQVTMKESFIKKGEINQSTIDLNNNENNKDGKPNKENNNNLIYFKNDDEILKYIKNRVKEGKIQNIKQKLELKSNEFSGFSISKKEKGYTIYEIKVEEDINKINEVMKSQKIEINNRPVQFIFIDELESLNKINEEYFSLKKMTNLNVKNDYQKSIEMEKKENKSIKNNNEIKDENKNIKASLEGIFKPKIKPNEEKEKIQSAKKQDNENKFVNSTSLTQLEDKKAKEMEKEKKASKALTRFRRAMSQKERKVNDKKEKEKKENEKNSGYSNKVHALAKMLKEHMNKPLNEIEEKKETQEKIFRGGSVECRKSRIAESNMVKLLENVPITKKPVKKPKLSNFVNN